MLHYFEVIAELVSRHWTLPHDLDISEQPHTSSVTTPEFKSPEKMPTVAVGARRGGASPQDATFVLIFGVFRPFSRRLQDLGSLRLQDLGSLIFEPSTRI